MELTVNGSVGPVTAILVHGRHILAGCGRTIRVYEAGTSDLETTFNTFPSSTVHGFRLGPAVDGKEYVCVFGAKCIRILRLKDQAVEGTSCASVKLEIEAVSAAHEVEDWIWDVAWLQTGDTWTLALALAHNVVLQWDWHTGVVRQRVTCVEECILYCARFIGSRWQDLMLASGTVFNQVVLWRPGSHDSDSHRPRPVLHRLTGHKGVIFSIFYHGGLKRICSVSDDRSIIVYQLHFPAASSADLADGDPEDVDWEGARTEPMLTVFGHSGRVWDAVLLSDCFVSIGEDAHCIVWNYEGNIVRKHKGHKGRSIWSLAASEDETYVVTGGGDCSIRQWRMEKKADVSLSQIQLTIPASVKVCADDFVRTLVLWDFDTVILTTNAGSVLSHSAAAGGWQRLVHDADFASYSTVAVSAQGMFLALAGITGHVRLLHRGQGLLKVKETKSQLHSSKVCGLTWVSDSHILSTGLEGLCVLSSVQHTEGGAMTMSTVAQLQLPTCKHRWAVSGCLLSSSSQSYLVCGDRNGSIHCYQLPQPPNQDEQDVLHPAQTFTKVHGSAGVTCVRYHDNTVFTTGRDGQYRCWAMKQGRLQLLNCSRVFKGFEWLDRLWVEENYLHILGFYASKFVVWDQRQGEQLLEVECGGGHRAWDCCRQGQGYRFVFIKAKEVVMVTAGQRSSQNIVAPPLHGMKLWDMKHIYTHTDGRGGLCHVLCTGSEDTTLSLGTLHNNQHPLATRESNPKKKVTQWAPTFNERSPFDRLDLAPYFILMTAKTTTLTSTGSLQWTGHHSLHGHLSSVRALASVQSGLSSPDRPETVHSGLDSSDRPETSPSLKSSDSSSRRDHDCRTDFHSGGNPPTRFHPADGENIPGDDHSHSSPAKESADNGRGVSTLVFSAGGRAQIQAWRVTVGKPSSTCGQSEGVMAVSCGETRGKGERTSSQTQEGFTVHGKNSTAKTGEDVSAVSCRETHQIGEGKTPPSSQTHEDFTVHGENHTTKTGSGQGWHEGLFRTAYEHLGGCFLGESRHKQLHRPWKTRYLKLDPETRIMCLDAIPISQLDGRLSTGLHLLATAGSDAVLRLFLFDEAQRQFRLLCHSSHHRGCMLKVLIHQHPAPTLPGPRPQRGQSRPLLLSAATDGLIAVWDLQPLVQWLLAGAKRSKLSSSACEDLNSALRKPSGSGRDGSATEMETLPCPLADDAVRSSEEGQGDGTGINVSGQRGVDQGSSAGEESGDDEDDDEDSDDDQGKKDRVAGSAAGVQSSVVRAQYLGDVWEPALQEVLAGAGGEVSHRGSGRSAEEAWAPFQEVKAHQSGVNSLHVKSCAGGHLLLASGGDDNALTVHRLTLTAASTATPGSDGKLKPKLDALTSVSKPDAHAAQIAGVWVLSSCRVVTASIDQRVNLWKLTDDFELELEGSRFVDVTDMSNMEVWQDGNNVHVGICGEGVALLTIQDISGKDHRSQRSPMDISNTLQ